MHKTEYLIISRSYQPQGKQQGAPNDPPKGELPMFPPVPGWWSMLKWIHEQCEAEKDEQHLGEHQQS